MGTPDTIAAPATPPGTGGVAIIRVSGPAVAQVAEAVAGGLPEPRRAVLRRFRDAAGEVVDTGLVLYFPGPGSYTGEDVLELHGHGGPVVTDLVLGAVLAAGARPARPGEFTERAFLNGRLDLAQAEAVADLIEAGSAQAARSALRSLEGALSRRLEGVAAGLTELRAWVEAALDFAEEEIDFLAEGEAAGRTGALLADLARVEAEAAAGRVLHDGLTVVLAGAPNAGKSSLLNVLAGRETAIVTHLPGTTRDVLREHLQVDGLPLHLVDTAGLREAADAIEAEGVRRARRELAAADRALVVVDDAADLDVPEEVRRSLPPELPFTVVHNKIDLTGRAPGLEERGGVPHLWLSARTGAGLERLREHLKATAGYVPGEGLFSARRRHLEALARARRHLESAQAAAASGAGELLAEDLRLAQQALGEITGEVAPDDLLGEIFSRFCIGK